MFFFLDDFKKVHIHIAILEGFNWFNCFTALMFSISFWKVITSFRFSYHVSRGKKDQSKPDHSMIIAPKFSALIP